MSQWCNTLLFVLSHSFMPDVPFVSAMNVAMKRPSRKRIVCRILMPAVFHVAGRCEGHVTTV